MAAYAAPPPPPAAPPPNSTAVTTTTTSSAHLYANVGHPALQRFGWGVPSSSSSLSEDDVELLDAYTVKISMPPIPFCRPQTPETLSIAVPAGALLSGRTTFAESLLVIASGGTSGRLSGHLLDSPHEGLVQCCPTNFTMILSGDISMLSSRTITRVSPTTAAVKVMV